MNKLQRIEEMERQLAALKAEVEQEAKPKPWEPEGGEWRINLYGGVRNDFSVSESRDFGIERKTKEQAEKAAKAMRTHNRLLAYVAEFAPDYEFEYGLENCYAAKTPTGKNVVVADVSIMDVGKVYMPREVAEDLCRKMNSGEVVL